MIINEIRNIEKYKGYSGYSANYNENEMKTKIIIIIDKN